MTQEELDRLRWILDNKPGVREKFLEFGEETVRKLLDHIDRIVPPAKAAWLDFEELVYAIMRGYVDEATRRQERVPTPIARLIAGNIVSDSKAKAERASKEAKKNCESCWHADFVDAGDYGACRRDPPIGRGATGWPAIRRQDWCRRHEFPRIPMEIVPGKPSFIDFPQ